jgi:neopullulanase
MRRILKVTIVSIIVLCGIFAVFAQTPKISKIEPPNWWANHTVNPVRLLVRGENFRNAKVVSKSLQLKVSNVRVNKNATYLFFDAVIAPTAKPATYNFEVSTAAGKSLIPFEILPTPKAPKTITNDDIIYLIMPDRFSDGDVANNVNVDKSNPRMWHGGDFRGIINHLDYLKELGITAIWLNPWYDNDDEIANCDKPWCPMASYHGYGSIDYYGVENHFGTLADLRELIKKANENGIKVIQDQVANHIGFRHEWVKNPPLENWFPPFSTNSFNNSVLLSPNASPAERDNLLKGWFDFTLPDLNQDEPEVAKYEIQNALWWIGTTGISGIRQDTVQYLSRGFIRDLSLAIDKQYPKFYMVGEVFEDDSAQTSFFQGGKTGWDGIDTKLPSVFDFKLWRTSIEVFTGKKPMRSLRDVLKYDGLYGDINRVTTFTNNHDTKRFMSLDGATKEGAELHTAFILATRGIPQLYYGEEVGMTGGDDPFNRNDFTKFDKSGLSKDESDVYWFTRNWIDIRKTYPALRSGKTIDLHYDKDVYVFARQYKGETIVIALNRGNADATVQIDENNLGFTKGKYSYGANGSNLKKEYIEKNSDIFSVNGSVLLTIPANNVIAFDVKKVLN